MDKINKFYREHYNTLTKAEKNSRICGKESQESNVVICFGTVNFL